MTTPRRRTPAASHLDASTPSTRIARRETRDETRTRVRSPARASFVRSRARVATDAVPRRRAAKLGTLSLREETCPLPRRVVSAPRPRSRNPCAWSVRVSRFRRARRVDRGAIAGDRRRFVRLYVREKRTRRLTKSDATGQGRRRRGCRRRGRVRRRVRDGASDRCIAAERRVSDGLQKT